MGRDVGAFLTGLIIIAIVFTLVRPNSEGPKFVQALGAAISNMLSAATGGAPQTTSGTATGTGTQTAGATSTTPGTTTGAGAATAGAGSSVT